MAIQAGGVSGTGVSWREVRRLVVSVPFIFCAVAFLFIMGAGATTKTRVASLHNAALLYDSDWHYIRLIRAEEKRSTDSYRNSSGTLAHSNRHVLGLVFKLGGTTDFGGSSTMPTTTGGTTSSTGGTGVDGELIQAPAPQVEEEPLETTSITTGATSAMTTGVSTGSTTGSPGVTTFDYTFYIWVDSPGEIAPINGRTPTLVSGTYIGVGVPAGVGVEIRPGEEAYVHLASEEELSGGSLTVTLETLVVSHVPDDPATTMVNEMHDETDSYFKTVTYDITKYMCQDSSIDTRKAFGTANREGELADDPNAEAAELNFGDWVWRGGLFVGNMPWQTGDQSGLARAQLYPQTSSRTTPCRLATLSMFYRGTAPDITTAVTLGAYVPGGSDPNLGSSASTVKWPTRWDIQPRTSPGSPRDDSKDPVYKVAFPSNALPNEYANWQMTSVGVTDSDTNVRAFQAIGVAIENEDTFVTTPSSAWRYFGSEEYPADFSTFPDNDCGPRLWVVDYDSDSVFSHHWSP